MKKVVIKVELYDDKVQTKAMKAVSSLSGIESLSVDKKDQKITLIGDIDPVKAVSKLKKLCHVEIVFVGPAKEEKKPEPPKVEKEPSIDIVKVHEAYWDQMRMAQLYQNQCCRIVEENPNACVIC